MKEHLKTALLVLLGVSALYLLWRTWVYDGSLFGREGAEPEAYAPARLDYAPSSAIPAKCAVTRGGIRGGVQYDPRTEAVYEAFKPLLAKALSGASDTREYGEMSDWEKALGPDSVYFEFNGSIPMPLLSAWLSVDGPAGGDVSAVMLSFGNGTELRWLEADGSLWGADTGITPEQWPELPELDTCAFAFESRDAAALHPLQLLIEQTAPRPPLVLSEPPSPDDTVYSAFLEHLEMSAQGTPFYMRGGTRVYVDVENGLSCEFSPDGTVLFVNSGEGGRSNVTGELRPSSALRAWETVSLLEPAIGSARFEIGRVTQAGERITVEFMVISNDVPVLWKPVIVEIEHGVIRRISLTLFRAAAGGDGVVPLPLRQAVELVPKGGEARLDIRYVIGDGGNAQAGWAVRN